MKHPIHLSQNLSVKLLAEINKVPADIKQAQKKKAFRLKTLRADIKAWFAVNKIEDVEEGA